MDLGWTERWWLLLLHPGGPEGRVMGLPYLGGVHLSLDDVEDGDVAVVGLTIPACGHHHVLGL